MAQNWRGFWIAIATNFFALGIYYSVLSFLRLRSWNNAPDEALWKNLHNIVTYLFWGIGFSQALHIAPIALWLWQRDRNELMKGILMGAAFTALFCGSCFIVVFPSFSSYLILR